MLCWGAGIAQWLECRTGDRKVPGSSPGRSGGRIFFSRVSFLCWLLFRYPFHPRVTAVAHKRSRPFCQKCRWQVTAKHTYTLCGFEWCNTVTWCMVEWCPQNLHRNGSISDGTSHAAPKERYQYTTSMDINNMRYKRIQSLIQNHMPMCAVSLLESREQHYIKAMNNNCCRASLSHRTYKRNIDRSGFSHRCKHCGKTFQKPSQLVRHERIHTGG